jgi:putative serine protease PepD
VTIMPGSPADIAGLKVGDVVTAVDGDKVDAKHTLAVRMVAYGPGDTLTLTVVRGGNTMQMPVTLAASGSA